VTKTGYVTTRVAADRVGVGLSTLQRWAAQGIVKPAWRTPGGQARWDVDDLRVQLNMPGAHGDEGKTTTEGSNRDDAGAGGDVHARKSPVRAQADSGLMST
jgi:hypothetical protein